MTTTDTFVIQTQGLSKVYNGTTALQDLNLQVPQHSIFGFLGPNGAGKSTTIKLLLGLARPSVGSATVFGLDSVRDSVAIRRRVGYLAQHPRFYEHMTARETLRFAARFFYTGPRDAIEERIDATLDLVDLADKADRSIKGFSGGERQRLGIAQAQINQPDLLILDEPAAALDPLGRRDVLALLERLRSNTTIFFSTHILDDVQRVSDRVAILNRGRLIAQAPVKELLAGSGPTSYHLLLTGNVQEAYARVASQPWVSSLDVRASNGQTEWQVHVTDVQAAEAQLLALVMANGQVTIMDFGRRQSNLEDVFMNLVEGGKHGN
ncbi:MAG: ABC transporter ATP-binding protein [Chloroflexota bacterium]|nr:ABC transporter ATP-binding protein [Chloroflexota bacterium]